MLQRLSGSKIWGAPKKFGHSEKERKVSWLELFYDLIYVIAISKVTVYFSLHNDFNGFLDYIYVFGFLFWGWLNGSLYHDYTGNNGVRSRLIILWQMFLVAILIISFSGDFSKIFFRMTVAIMCLQFYLTYIWLSLTFYDKSIRKGNFPYTILYLVSFSLMGLTLFLPKLENNSLWVRMIFYFALILNFIPPFISVKFLKVHDLDVSLTPSMMERLGTLTTIVLGEVVLAIISGISGADIYNMSVITCFGIGMMIAFALWWIFFDLIGNRNAKKGFDNATYIELSFIPTLMILGMIAVSFKEIYQAYIQDHVTDMMVAKETLGVRIGLFLYFILVITYFLNFEIEDKKPGLQLRGIIFIGATLIILFSEFVYDVSVRNFLLVILGILSIIIIFIIRNWWINGEIQSEKIL